MAKREFSTIFTGNASDMVAKVRSGFEKANGSFSGDATSGDFTVPTTFGQVAGSYKVDGQTVTVTINGKPLFLPMNVIESKVKNLLQTSS